MRSINILGFGTMGMQLAAFFSVIGYRVTVWNREVTDVKIKRFTREKRIIEKKIGTGEKNNEIEFVTEIGLLPAALTIEALIEDLDVKKGIVNKLKYQFDYPWLFTNSSSFSPNEIHDNAYAMHFFNPIHSVSLVETTCDVSDLDLFADIQAAGMTVVQAKMNRGFIANYILFREISASMMLIEKYGYDSKTIDLVLHSLGRQTSVFDIVDFVGVDVTKSILENLREYDESVAVPEILEQAVSFGVLGKKNKTTIRSLLDNK